MNTDQLLDAIGEINDDMLAAARPLSMKKHVSMKRVLALAAALVLFAAGTVAALAAADNESAYKLAYALAPSIAQKLKPVNMVCEDNGIRMEVVSAYIHGSAADVYVSLQDMTGDRIDETTDLFDSYELNLPYDGSGTCRLINFDAKSKLATFLISITVDGGIISGDKLTFGVSEFLSHKKVIDADLTSVFHWSAISERPAAKVHAPYIRGAGGTAVDGNIPSVLSPDPQSTYSPIKSVVITAIGFVDGKLHVQAHYADILRADNHGYVYLKDAGGNEVHCTADVAFWDDAKSGSYEEYIFDVKQEDLSQYTLWGHFCTAEPATKGKWQVTFPVVNQE